MRGRSPASRLSFTTSSPRWIFSGPSLDAMEYAVQVADDFGARMTLLHALEPIYYGGRLELQAIEPKWQNGA
jgi:hypothetical protein